LFISDSITKNNLDDLLRFLLLKQMDDWPDLEHNALKVRFRVAKQLRTETNFYAFWIGVKTIINFEWFHTVINIIKKPEYLLPDRSSRFCTIYPLKNVRLSLFITLTFEVRFMGKIMDKGGIISRCQII
jgi:hypothetical protein